MQKFQDHQYFKLGTIFFFHFKNIFVRWDEIFKKKMISYIIVKNAIGWIQPSFNLKIDVCEHNLQANEICQVGKTRRKGASQIVP
jgi:hypothetical protein